MTLSKKKHCRVACYIGKNWEFLKTFLDKNSNNICPSNIKAFKTEFQSPWHN